MPSIHTLIDAIKSGDTTEVVFSSIPHAEIMNETLMQHLIFCLEEQNEVDTLHICGSDLTPEHRKRFAALILTKPSLRHLSFSQWEMDEEFLKSMMQRPLLSLGMSQCGFFASMSSIIASSLTLEKFSISFSDFNDSDTNNIMKIKTLKKFSCWGTQFSIKSLMELALSNQIEEINFNAQNITSDDIKPLQETLKKNTRLKSLVLMYKNLNDGKALEFIHGKRPLSMENVHKIKTISIMSNHCYGVEKAFSTLSGSELRTKLLEFGYNPNTYVDIYYKRNENNPVLNCHIANEEHARAVTIIKAFPDLDPMMTDWEGKNALHIACKAYSADEVVSALLEHHLDKLDLNARDNRGCTPLHYLCAYGKLALVQKLISLGAKVDIKDKLGRTPLDYAKFSKVEVEKMLNSIAVCPFRDAKATTSSSSFMLPASFADSPIPYFPGQMRSVLCLENVKSSLAYVSSNEFTGTYPKQKLQETKRLQELASNLSGKSVIDQCMENQGKVRNYLSTHTQAPATLITHSYDRSKSSNLLRGALVAGMATAFAFKFLTRKG